MQIGPTYIVSTSILAVVLVVYSMWIIRGLKTLINRQNDTIQRLLDREPVTYAEVNKEPPKRTTERFAAWGNQIVDMDEIEP